MRQASEAILKMRVLKPEADEPILEKNKMQEAEAN